jgi:hypothetical protein
MNKILVLSLVGSGLSMFAATSEVRGQAIYGPQSSSYIRPPVVSPYLDLIRSRNTPAINYYLGTRSEIDRRASDVQLRQLEDEFNRRPTVAATEDLLDQPQVLPSTGHGTAFMNTSHFFGGIPSAQVRPTTGAPAHQQARPQQGRPTTGRVR